MISGNYNYQFIDWKHDPIEDEDFKHVGTMSTHLITPTLTIGLSNYINMSYQQTIGIRTMNWLGEGISAHHRDENTLSDFTNAIGNAFGDGKISFKYLLTNTGMQPGSRFFLGGGLTIPSKSVLTKNPFLDEDENGITDEEHRHFSLSDGCYKTNFELQYYIKRNSKIWFDPAFLGITFNYTKPIKESQYGYLKGASYSTIGSILFSMQSKNNWMPKGISLGLSYLKTEKSFWDDYIEPNSETKFFIPSIGLIWNHKKYGGIAVNLKYIKNESLLSENTTNANIQAYELSIGYRKTLDYTIPWLYY